MPQPEPTARRSQQARREGTRQALLESTVACLVELGYARTTTTEVVKRAGVSQGALFKHFPTKSALVAAATEQLFADLFLVYEAAFTRAESDEEPIVAAVHGLWGVFCRPELIAVYRLYVESPVDPELHAALVPVVARHGENLRSYATRLFPELASSPTHWALVESVVYALQGLSLQRAAQLDPEVEARVVGTIAAFARSLFPAATPRTLDKAAIGHGNGGIDR